MPTYDYKCSGCGDVQELVRSIAERKDPEQIPCALCGGHVNHTLGAALTVRGVQIKDKKPDFFRDTLKDMKKNVGRTNTLDRVL